MKEESSDAIKLAKQFKDEEVEITRKDGKVNKIKEQLLWDEIRVLSDQTEAYEFMKAKYPKAFDLSEAVSKKAHEIDEFAMLHFGFHSDRMTLRDIINLIQIFVLEK